MKARRASRTCYDDAVDRELARWPGVTWRRTMRGKHNAIILTFGQVSRFNIYPASPSDSRRGVLAQICDLRKSLRFLGATRV